MPQAAIASSLGAFPAFSPASALIWALVKTLVCRCEDVTLHELEHALSLGHQDIESVKRYTGFGTGWCQGKGCMAVCGKLIAERGGDPGVGFTPRPPYHPAKLADLAGLDPDWGYERQS